MAEHTEDALLREIDEELRHDQAKKLWQTYGKYVVAIAVAVVIGVAGYKGWEYWDRTTKIEQSTAFAEAQQLAEQGKIEEARQAFSSFAADARSGHAALARFREAGLVGEAGDPAAAAGQFQALAEDDGVPRQYRDLARLLGGLYALDAGADGKAVAERLAPLDSDASPYRFSAREIIALARMTAGDTDGAREMLTRLSEDSAAPAGVSARAQELLASLGE